MPILSINNKIVQGILHTVPGKCPRCYKFIIVNLRDTMGGQIAIVQGVRVGGLNNSSSSELRNGNVIWVSICAILTKGYDNFGLDTSQVSDNFCDNLGWMSRIKVSINIIQKID